MTTAGVVFQTRNYFRKFHFVSLSISNLCCTGGKDEDNFVSMSSKNQLIFPVQECLACWLRVSCIICQVPLFSVLTSVFLSWKFVQFQIKVFFFSNLVLQLLLQSFPFFHCWFLSDENISTQRLILSALKVGVFPAFDLRRNKKNVMLTHFLFCAGPPCRWFEF